MYQADSTRAIVHTNHHDTVRCCYNAVNFLTNIHKSTRSSPVRARYGVFFFFANPASDWYSALVPVIIYIISYDFGPLYNGTRLYYAFIQDQCRMTVCIRNSLFSETGMTKYNKRISQHITLTSLACKCLITGNTSDCSELVQADN